METNTTFLPQNSLHQQILVEIDHMDALCSKIDLILQEDLYPLRKDSYHFIAKMLTRLTGTKRSSKAFASSVFQSVYRSEITSAGAGYLSFLFAISFAKHLIRADIKNRNDTELQSDLKEAIEYFKSRLTDFTKTSKAEDVQNIIKACAAGDEDLSSAIWETLKLSGMEGKIFVENGRQENYIVEHKEGFNFQLNPFSFMLKENKSWNAFDCKILVVDGLVEKVSELDHILTKNLETHQPMVIFAHGFSEEVVATLKANQERGVLDIQPVRIPSDIDSLNVANDISVVCGTLPVSSMKGDMLVFVKYEDLPTVERIRLKENQCIIENSKTGPAVSSQICSLLEKRQNHYLHEEVQNLFDKRMHSLINNTVVIHLPNAPVNKQDEQRMKIDLALRQAKTTINNGVVNTGEIVSSTDLKNVKNQIKICFEKALVETFKNTQQNISPLSALLGVDFAAKTVLLFLLSSGLVEITY